jgi:hypothetical protein
MKANQTCLVHFSNGKKLELPFRHFCGGTSIKLPMSMADFRKQWVPYCHGSLDRAKTVGRYCVESVTFPK